MFYVLYIPIQIDNQNLNIFKMDIDLRPIYTIKNGIYKAYMRRCRKFIQKLNGKLHLSN